MRTDRSVDPAIESRFRDLYSQTLPAVFGFLSLRVGGDQALAEDLTAETYAAAVVRFREGGGDDVDLSWLRTVAKRRLIDHWRRMSVARRNAVRLAGTAQSPATTSELRDCVVAALAGLSEQQRTALLLQHVDGYTVAEIAEILGRSEKATESLLTRARSGFRAFYTEVDHG